jgi:hypothetical protein
MVTNYFLGVGGTGARVAEALIHCCAMGFGPKDLFILLVDPDQGNGNLDRTVMLLKHYDEAYRAVDPTLRGSKVRILSTSISYPEKLVWNVLTNNESLQSYIDLGGLKTNQPELAELASVLFTQQELKTNLNEGFRGHPAIGATVMAGLSDADEPWKTFWDSIKTNEQQHGARVFLAGSIFGGTGAAGVPTFGSRSILKFGEHALLGGNNDRSRIYLGGVLVLPYFVFDSPETDRDEQEMFVSWTDFPIATKAALQFYSTKLDANNLAFDELYFIGDSIKQNVGAFHPGNRDQRNKPHYVELASALAAIDFFTNRQEPNGGGRRFFGAARKTETVDWDALPLTRMDARVDALKNLFRFRAAAFVTFAHSLRHYVTGKLGEAHKEIRDRWYRQHFDRNGGPRDAESVERLNAVLQLCDDVVHWLAELSTGDYVSLADPERLQSRDIHEIHSLLRGPGERLTFNEGFLNMLNEKRVPDERIASDQLFHLLYEVSAEYACANYRLDPKLTGEEL